MSTEAAPERVEPVDLRGLYEATFVEKSNDEWNKLFEEPTNQLSQLLVVISKFIGQLEFFQATETDDDLKVGWRLCSNNRNFRSLIVVLKEKCLSELKIEPQQLSTEKITRKTIDKLFKFMPSEEVRISELKDSLDKDVYVGFYRQNEAKYYSRKIITDDLTEYIERGKSIRTDKHPHLQNIIKAFLEVQNHDFGLIGEKVSNPQALPFFLICCSSGTGKTQLPFSLPQAFPIFYFLFNRKPSPGTQLIYSCFSSVSGALQTCIEKDLEKFRLFPRNYQKIIQDEDKDSAAKKLKESIKSQEDEEASMFEQWLSESFHEYNFATNESFFTPGFIVGILEKYFSSDRSVSSLELLARLETFKFASMTYPAAKQKIIELCQENKVDFTPIIFIDETNLSRNMKSNLEVLKSFLFLRTVLRLIHVIPVFMGTNFIPAGFFFSKESNASRSADGYYHTYVIHNLPPVPAKICYEEECKSLELATKNENAKEVVKKIYEFLKDERPLFFYDFVKNLNEYLENNSLIKFKELFGSLIGNFFQRFRERTFKPDCNWEFDYAQFCYLASRNREIVENCEDENICFANDGIPFFSDLRYIERHAGFLVGPASCEQCSDYLNRHLAALLKEDASVTKQLIDERHPKSTTISIGSNVDENKVNTKENAGKRVGEIMNEEKKDGLYTDTSATFFKLFGGATKRRKVNWYQYYDDKGRSFYYTPYTIFPNMERYCFSGLAMAALKEDQNLIFTDKAYNSERISTLNALCDISANLDPGISYEKEKYRFEAAEALVHTAIVIASHANGFETATIKQVLEAFVQELDYYAEYDSVLPPSIDFAGLQDLETRVNDKFPYLAPVDQQWNTDFVEFMQIIFPRFQYGTANYPREGNDMFVNRDNSREYSATTFMCIEVKCYEESIGEKRIGTIANTLLGNHGEFFLLVVRKRVENESKENVNVIDTEENTKKIDTTPKGNIFLLQKREQEKSGFYFKCIQRVQRSRKIVFAIDLGTINGENIDAITRLFAKW